MASSVKIVIGEVRFSYLHVFEPWAPNDGDMKNYTATLLIPKSNTALVEQVKKAIADCYNASVTDKWGGKKPVMAKASPLHDGDEPKDDGESRGEAYAGCYYINAKSRQQPGIVDKRRQPILNSEDFYSGCYGYASVGFSGFSNSGNNGISCYLNNIMMTREGDPLGGTRASAATDFDGIEVEDEEDL